MNNREEEADVIAAAAVVPAKSRALGFLFLLALTTKWDQPSKSLD